MGRKKLACENKRAYWFMIVYRDKSPEFEKELRQLLTDNCWWFKNFFYIYHDQDNTKTKHYHVILNTTSVRTLGFISKSLNTDIKDIETIDIPKKAIRYLIHVDNPKKEQYDYRKIQTNYSDLQVRRICEPLILTKKKTDNQLFYIINLINTYDIGSFSRLVDVLADNGEGESLSYVMGKHCYSITNYINSRNMVKNHSPNKNERKEII